MAGNGTALLPGPGGLNLETFCFIGSPGGLYCLLDYRPCNLWEAAEYKPGAGKRNKVPADAAGGNGSTLHQNDRYLHRYTGEPTLGRRRQKMTDEEKAEEYVKEQILKHNRDLVLRPKNAVTYIDELKQAHLDGLAEGRKGKWHDLRKDPNDLPKHSGEYWCKWEDGTYSTEHYFGDNGFGNYVIADSGFGSYVIAWCEFPLFEEK